MVIQGLTGTNAAGQSFSYMYKFWQNPFRIEVLTDDLHMITIGHESLLYSDAAGALGISLMLRGSPTECLQIGGCEFNSDSFYADSANKQFGSIKLDWLTQTKTYYWTSQATETYGT